MESFGRVVDGYVRHGHGGKDRRGNGTAEVGDRRMNSFDCCCWQDGWGWRAIDVSALSCVRCHELELRIGKEDRGVGTCTVR
jgi:hypothetical protein